MYIYKDAHTHITHIPGKNFEKMEMGKKNGKIFSYPFLTPFWFALLILLLRKGAGG